MSGGGGGSAPETVMASPAPWASAMAGNWQAQAAQAASAAAQRMAQEAILAINKNYATARNDLQPYRTTGVQALDKLNQYIGLDPYNPGSAPTAPEKPTIQSLASLISRAEAKNEIMSNFSPLENSSGQAFGGVIYSGGLGNYAPTTYDARNGANAGGNPYGKPSTFLSDPRLIQQTKEYLAEDQLPLALKQYDSDYQQYQKDLEEYNQNLAWYNQYKAEGPKTAEQITQDVINQPGYQSIMNQGTQAILQNKASAGLVKSGGALRDLNNFGGQLTSQFYGDMLSRLAQQAGIGANAAGASAQQAQNQGAGVASILNNLGDTTANSILAAAQARANALQNSNMVYKTFGGGGGGGGLGGIGSILGGIGSIASAFSSKKLKNKVNKPSTKAILDRVKSLDIDRWQYKGIDRTHIGPYAEDFKRKFGVGDGQSINLIDMMGVLFASVKELAKNQETK